MKTEEELTFLSYGITIQVLLLLIGITMMITSKGQVTIPKEFRDMCGLQPHTEVEFALEDGKLVIHPAAQPKDRGSYIVEHFRRHATNSGLTTDEIMAMTRGED